MRGLQVKPAAILLAEAAELLKDRPNRNFPDQSLRKDSAGTQRSKPTNPQRQPSSPPARNSEVMSATFVV